MEPNGLDTSVHAVACPECLSHIVFAAWLRGGVQGAGYQLWALGRLFDFLILFSHLYSKGNNVFLKMVI